jgi:hypothetical protein
MIFSDTNHAVAVIGILTRRNAFHHTRVMFLSHTILMVIHHTSNASIQVGVVTNSKNHWILPFPHLQKLPHFSSSVILCAVAFLNTEASFLKYSSKIALNSLTSAFVAFH